MYRVLANPPLFQPIPEEWMHRAYSPKSTPLRVSLEAHEYFTAIPKPTTASTSSSPSPSPSHSLKSPPSPKPPLEDKAPLRPALKRFPSQSYRPPIQRAISEPYRRGQGPITISELEWHHALMEQTRLQQELQTYRVRFESIAVSTQETPQNTPPVKEARFGGFRAAKAKTLAKIRLALTRFVSPKTSQAA